MPGDALLKLLGAVGGALYVGWVLVSGLRSGTIQPLGAGTPVRRDRNPGIFAATAILMCAAIALALLVAALTLLHPGT